MRVSRWFFAMLLGAAYLTGGCATHALWGVKDCSASDSGNLAIRFAPEKHDFLVQYDELRGKKTKATECYWLYDYSDNPPKNHGPASVQDTDFPKMTMVPILKVNDPVPETGYSAMYFPLEKTFDLYHDGVDMGRFTLPSYSTPAGKVTATRVMLTPPAVLADTVMVGTVVALYTSPYWIQIFNH
jgi:hypothetical protein